MTTRPTSSNDGWRAIGCVLALIAVGMTICLSILAAEIIIYGWDRIP